MAFQGFLRQSSVKTVLIGPFLDEDDGKTAEAGLTITRSDVELSKIGGTVAQKNDSSNSPATGTNGYYRCALDVTDTNTVGQLTLTVHMSGALPIRLDYHVVEEAVYDAMYGASAAGPLQSTVAARKLDVGSGGHAGIDYDNVTGTIGYSDVSWVDSSNRVDVGKFLGAVVVLNASNYPKISVAQWLDTGVSVGATSGLPRVDTAAVSDDANAADNLELITEQTRGVILPTDAVSADALATDAVNEIRNAITGGAYALNTTSLGNIGIDLANVQNQTSVVPMPNVTIGWNASWDAEVQSEVNDALVALNLDTNIDRNADLIESQRGSHTWQGNVFYVSPNDGNDSTGTGTRALPYATIQAAHDDLVADSNHDVIILLADAAGVTTHTVAATTTISKRYCFIRGPGRDFIITRSGNGPTIDITGDGVEISGCQIASPGASATSSGINVTTSDFVRIHNCWILDTQGDGLHLNQASNCHIHDNHFDGTGIAGSAQAIHVVGTGSASSNNVIRNNHMSNTGGTSILIEGGTILDTEIYGNTIHNAGAWAISISADSTNAQVYHNVFGNNTSGNVTDSGTTSIIKNNRDWLSSTVESRQLDVTATGAAGIDWANVENPTTALDLSGTDIQLCDTITTYTNNTPQTGDNFALIGTAGVGLTAVKLSSAGLDSIVVETGLNARQALSIAVASAAGKLSGAATTTVVILGAGVATTRITATVDASGNRSAVTLAAPA